MASAVNLPLRPKRVSSALQPITLDSPLGTNKEAPSSSESLATVDTVWDDSPVSARSPPSSPTTPPSDDEIFWEESDQSQPSPSVRVKRRGRSPILTRPSLMRALRKSFPHVRPDKNISPSGRINNNYDANFSLTVEEGSKLPIENFSSTDDFGTVLDDLAKANAISQGEGVCRTEVQQTRPKLNVIEQETAVPGCRTPGLESATNSVVKAELHVTKRQDCSHEPKLSMPCNWESENENPEDSPGFSTRYSKGSFDDRSPPSSRSDTMASKQPLAKSISSQNKKERSPQGTLIPIHPEFTPFHKNRVNVNAELHRLFGGVDVQKADKARKGLKKGVEETGENYPSIFFRPKKLLLGYGKGHIYMFESPNFPGFIKIGMTTQPVNKRIGQWKDKCRIPINIIPQAGDKAFHNVDLVEKIIHTELWAQRRIIKCGKCKRKHKFPLKMEYTKETRMEELYASHGEWFEISHEEAFKVVTSWREWASPDSRSVGRPAISSVSSAAWQRAFDVISGRILDFPSSLRCSFVLPPYGHDRQLQGYWIRRYYDLTSVIKHEDSDIWREWRQPPSFSEIFLEFFDFNKESLKGSYGESSRLGYYLRGALFWIEAVVRSMIALVLLLIPFYIAWLCWSEGGSRWSAIASGFGCAFMYFVIKWMLMRR